MGPALERVSNGGGRPQTPGAGQLTDAQLALTPSPIAVLCPSLPSLPTTSFTVSQLQPSNYQRRSRLLGAAALGHHRPSLSCPLLMCSYVGAFSHAINSASTHLLASALPTIHVGPPSIISLSYRHQQRHGRAPCTLKQSADNTSKFVLLGQHPGVDRFL